jgi:DNA gyrase inhibitor GyrI
MAGCSVFGIRTAEELKYDVISKSGDIEIRKYQPYISAVASMKGSYDEVQGDLFRILAGYIFGKNSTDSKIAMTAPVQTNPETKDTSEKIAMTAPVVMKPERKGVWKMAFSMPSKYTMQSLPKPLDPKVTLVEIPAKKFAVIRFSGSYDNLQKRSSKTEELSKWLSTQSQYKKVSEPVFAGYDPPFTLPFLRRNEVLIEIEE